MRKEIAEAIDGAIYAMQQVAMAHPDSSEHSRGMYEVTMDARLKLLDLGPLYEEADCPGHVASGRDPKICGLCGVHVDAMR